MATKTLSIPAKGDCSFKHTSDLRKKDRVMLKQQICTVTDVKWSAVGKHGHAKYRVTGRNLFTNKKVEEVLGGHDRVTMPDLIEYDADLLNIDEEHYVSLLVPATGETHMRVRLRHNNDMHDDIREQHELGEALISVRVQACWGKEEIIAFQLVDDEQA